MAQSSVPRRPVVLIILDGFGVNPGKEHNAIYMANTPNLDAYFSHFPHTTLQASGNAVGVPDGQMGNSEIGHMTLGAGNIVKQDIMRIDASIENGEFFENPAFIDALLHAKLSERPIHLLGLVSDGGVHSSLNHLLALFRLCKRYSVKPLLHMITDGRDTAPKSAINYLHQIEPTLHECGGAIATIMGRYYAMDRDNRWDRIELAWRAIVHGKGQHAHSAETILRSAYASGDSDEFLRPAILPTWQAPLSGDPLISFNFRKDRPRQIVKALGSAEFSGFDRGDTPLFKITTMMPYDKSSEMPAAFQPEHPQTTLAEILSGLGLRQFHCAETEKYPHVTYFFNGGCFDPYIGETQVLIPSPKVATYDLKPSMSANKVADAVVHAIEENVYSFILVNFANGDMVGHTAKADAVIEAIETLDREAGRVIDAAVAQDYSVVLTADHGNCEELIDPVTGAPHTQHTLYPVPCLIIDEEGWQLSCQGGLANVAPTVLQMMGLEQPDTMTARSLFLKPLGKQEKLISPLLGAA
jgi:2,3-bisphosphoglycerate-independent phosphoglycerate mutase